MKSWRESAFEDSGMSADDRDEAVRQELSGLKAAISEPLGYVPRILLAEDCPDTQLLISSFLADLGADVTVVSDGNECVEAAVEAREHNEDFHLILVDIRMPQMDGHSTARALREKGWKIPIVAITAAPSLGERNSSMHSGFDHFLAKNCLEETIVPTLKHLLPKPHFDS